MEKLVMSLREVATLIFITFPSFAFTIDIDKSEVLLAINKEDRLAHDLSRDERSKPEEVIPLLAIQPGDRVADIFGGGGYYSDCLLYTSPSPRDS